MLEVDNIGKIASKVRSTGSKLSYFQVSVSADVDGKKDLFLFGLLDTHAAYKTKQERLYKMTFTQYILKLEAKSYMKKPFVLWDPTSKMHPMATLNSDNFSPKKEIKIMKKRKQAEINGFMKPKATKVHPKIHKVTFEKYFETNQVFQI